MTLTTRYARAADGTHIAYQVTGTGQIDIVFLRAWHSDIEHEWNDPVITRIFRRLESVGRLIRFDRRGMGLSDRLRPRTAATIEERLDDLRAVLDACGSPAAFLVALGNGAMVCAPFAATYPERTLGLMLWTPSARLRWSPEYPWGVREEELPARMERLRNEWGTRQGALRRIEDGAPSRANDEPFINWMIEQQRRSGSAENAVALAQLYYDTDISDTLPAIHVPVVVMARSGGRRRDEARHVAARIPSARLVILPGEDDLAISGDTDAVTREIESFIDLVVGTSVPDTGRVLATLLFSDVVGATARAAAVGDRAWSALLEDHHRRALRLIQRHRGRLIDEAGDGILAAFDGPGRAIRCAQALVDDVRKLGLEVRVGVHTGECEVAGDRLRGLAVHISARVAALAGPSQVLVSGTVKDLVAGADFEFGEHGRHELKGVPGEWPIYEVRLGRT